MLQKLPIKSIRPLLPILLGGGTGLLGCLFIGGVLFFAFAAPSTAKPEESSVPTLESTHKLSFPTATTLPSATPTPTDTSTPVPTDTPAPTNTPVPPTYPPATKAPPTAVPTDTPIPSTPVPPGYLNGIQYFYFNIKQVNVPRNGEIGFEFKIKNISPNQVGYGFLGANCTDMAGNLVFFQASWQGPDAGTKKWLNPGDEIEWTDWWHNGIANPGDYRLQLVICYNTPGECNAGTGWEALSPFVNFKVN